MDKNSLSHTSWSCKYHIVFAPEYRRQIIYGRLKQDMGKVSRDLCGRKDISITKAKCCPDHVHMLLETPPKYNMSQIMGYLEGKNSLITFDRHAGLEYKYGNKRFWYCEYCIDTTGKNAEKMQDYIKNQLKEDYMADRISMKEFIDPFTGEPVNESKE